MKRETTAVLIVDDERTLAELYAAWLEEDYAVYTAYDGTGALDAIDETVAVALLDRQLPKLRGEDVLEAIRDEGYRCRVSMISAIEPDFDILELDCDEYLTKPVSRAVLRETVDMLVRRSAYEERLRDYFALVSKKAVLESHKEPAELTASAEYEELIDRIESLERRLRTTLERFDDRDLAVLLRDSDAVSGATDPET